MKPEAVPPDGTEVDPLRRRDFEQGSLDDRVEPDGCTETPAAGSPKAHEVKASPSPLAPGTLLAQRYLIASLLGRGGMGEVYLAEDLTLGEPVAVKLLLGTHETGTRQQRIFLEEVRSARQVSHPNVCRVHDVGNENGRLFLSMEYIEGQDLRSLLARLGRIPSPRALQIAWQACNGLAAIHEQGLLHLDLKPANLMVDQEGHTKITDFGVATRAGGRPRGGTQRYMPPEQLQGEVSPASDIYSFGLVLYELVTGQPAFFARSPRHLERLHKEVLPAPPSQVVPGIAPELDTLILACLSKSPIERPASITTVGSTLSKLLEGSEHSSPSLPFPTTPPPVPVAVGEVFRNETSLRRWPSSELPNQPYPVLFPYRHPALLAGRDRDLARLIRLLRTPHPILGLRALSGTGKSSLLHGGLVPTLRSAGRPVAYSRHPWEPGLERRLLADLFDRIPPQGGFVNHLVEAHRLARLPPVLVVDQLEELLRRGNSRELADLGLLLARTAQPRPETDGPPVRWILSYREDYHGDIVAWLQDVLAPARSLELEDLDELPWSLAGEDRFHAMSLAPLGTAPAGTDPSIEAERVFLAAIEKPLELLDATGAPRYPYRFAPGHALRLAQAFAAARTRRPTNPLAPELQVVLSHLLTASGPTAEGTVIEIHVPDNPDDLIDEALDRHLRDSLDRAFSEARLGSPEDRARAILALRELARAEGRNRDGLSIALLRGAIGETADQFLQRLSSADTRLVVAHEAPDGVRWALSHDRLAAAVIRLFEEDWRHAGLRLDSRLLSLREFVTLESALYKLHQAPSSKLPRGYFRRIKAHREALLWDEDRRHWWQACQRRRRSDRYRQAALALVTVGLLTAMVATIWGWTDQRVERRTQLEALVIGEPAAALRAFDSLSNDPEVDEAHILSELAKRPSPTEILELGLGSIPSNNRAEYVLETVKRLLPLVAENPEDPIRIANLVWALDFSPGRDHALQPQAQQLRERVLETLRNRHPPPTAPEPGDSSWINLGGGPFDMGTPTGAAGQDHERPQHTVELSPFRLQKHEVTNAQFARLDPSYTSLPPDLPAAFVNWYEAYTYAAWLGGRLPTEAEWEYAARAGCPSDWCSSSGEETTAESVAWILPNARAAGTFEPVRRPVGRLDPNAWGLSDMLGNLWEWTADWYAPYPHGKARDSWGPANGLIPRRILRGGCVRDAASFARPAYRNPTTPDHDVINNGFRPRLPPTSGG